MIRVLLVDDNVPYARVFSFTLNREPDMEVVGIATSLSEARSSRAWTWRSLTASCPTGMAWSYSSNVPEVGVLGSIRSCASLETVTLSWWFFAYDGFVFHILAQDFLHGGLDASLAV